MVDRLNGWSINRLMEVSLTTQGSDRTEEIKNSKGKKKTTLQLDTLQDGHNVQLSRATQRIFLSYSELERGRWKLNTGKFADTVESR